MSSVLLCALTLDLALRFRCLSLGRLQSINSLLHSVSFATLPSTAIPFQSLQMRSVDSKRGKKVRAKEKEIALKCLNNSDGYALSTRSLTDHAQLRERKYGISMTSVCLSASSLLALISFILSAKNKYMPQFMNRNLNEGTNFKNMKFNRKRK